MADGPSADLPEVGGPAPADSRLARWLRALTGVDEGLLALVPSERPRYTRLGGVIFGTGVIAAFSMTLALSQVFGHTSAVAVIPAIGWGLFIMTLDAWLVASLHGTQWRRRWWLILPRFALAIVFGILIAEPFVLRTFQTAIERRVLDDRQQALLAFETRLKQCNPGSGEPPAIAVTRNGRCQNAQIEVAGTPTPAALAARLESLRAQRRTQQNALHDIRRHQTRLDDIARRECNGGRGRGLSGRFGVGPSCKRNREEASAYRRSSQAGARERKLVALEGTITRVSRDLQTGADDYQKAVQQAIRTKVAARQANQSDIGLLERLGALHSLTQTNWYLSASEWLLRLFFIIIDCLPLLIKLMGGSTSYDRLVDRRLEKAERIFRETERTDEEGLLSNLALRQFQRERATQTQRDELTTNQRLASARREVEIDAEISRLANQLLGEDAGANGDGAQRQPGSGDEGYREPPADYGAERSV